MDAIVTLLVGVIDLVTAPIPYLASSGLLLAVFALAWAALALAIAAAPHGVDRAWRTLRSMPLGVQVVVWVLFLPIVAGIATWQLAWPKLARYAVIGGIAAWNLLVFLPAS